MSTAIPLGDVSNAPPSRLLRPKFFGSKVNGREDVATEPTSESSRVPSSPSAASPPRSVTSTPNPRHYDASPCQPRPTTLPRVSQKQDDTTPRSKKSYSGVQDDTTSRQSARTQTVAATAAIIASRSVNAPRTAAVPSNFAPKPRTTTPRPRAPELPRNPSPAQRGSGVTGVNARVRADSSARRSAETTANGNLVATRSRTLAATAAAEEIASLKKRSAAAQAEFDRLLVLKNDLQDKIRKMIAVAAEAVEARLAAEKDTEKTREETLKAQPKWEKQVSDERRRLAECVARNIEYQAALDEETEKVAVLNKSVAQRKLLITREQKRAVELQLEADKENAAGVQILAQLNEQIEKIAECANVCELAEKIRGEQVLRQMYYFNEYMEVKGNIRVFVRMRPPGENEQSCITVEENKVSLHSVTHKTVDGLHDQTSRWQFTFDRVFPESSSQQLVFDEISLLVQSALDGFKVAIFAYGQTGSGKTYTMEGPYVPHHERRQRKSSRAVQDSTAGMIPRALRLIFNHIEKLAMAGWKYSLSASYVEIYNEAVRDLLDTSNAVELKHDHNETTMNCKVVEVANEHQILSLLAKACEARATASTFTNDRSSRSHSVFQLRINARGAKNTELKGLLSLVDLAGSERIEKSQAVGERLKEAQSINKSLSALGDVIQSLADNASHVPYRNSKLTMLLRDSLGGDSKTLMFANICPSQANLQESVNTLRFASKVNSVKKDAKAKKKSHTKAS